ncbi:exonuclease domain-containing protein [Verrucomicrobia bacterium]|nr:exonuclease domain-containing protein [Verrucomicrobiota bacterium]
MDFSDIEFTAIDFESTGFREDGTDEPIQIGMASMRGMEIQKESFFRSFIAPKKRKTHRKFNTTHTQNNEFRPRKCAKTK